MVQNMHKIISVNSFTNKLRLRAAVVNAVAVRGVQQDQNMRKFYCTLSKKGLKNGLVFTAVKIYRNISIKNFLTTNLTSLSDHAFTDLFNI